MFPFEYELPSEAGAQSLEYRKAIIDVDGDYVCVYEIETLDFDGEMLIPVCVTEDEIRWAEQAWNRHLDAVHDYGC